MAIELASSAGQPLVLLNATEADEVTDLLSGASVTVVLGPFNGSTATRQLRLAQHLREAGVTIAFTGHGDPMALRLTAALAVRAGLSPEDALVAMTSAPAAILGIEASTGSLSAGKRADFVVMSGRPWDLHATVKAVFAGGALVEGEANQ